MINDLLDLSDLEQGLAKIHPAPTNLSSIIREIAIEMRDKTHELVIEIPGDIPNVLADAGRLYQALLHLVQNAKRFSPEGSQITISAEPVGESVSISVKDRGRGIPDDKLASVFQPFFQVEESQTRTIGGLGVGLYMVKGLCAAMNGDISVESKLGEGSTFTMTFPISDRPGEVDLGTVMCVWAHPDDESYLSAGVMQQTVADGRRVVCVTATRGEGGSQDPVKWPPEKMAEVREAEIAESLQILGVKEHHWLDYIDGHCTEVDDEEAIGKLVALIEEVQPKSVFTFGPDGHTGHPDHIAVSRWTTAAFKRAAPSGAGLYYATVTPEWAEQWCPVVEPYNVFAPGTPITTPRQDLGVEFRLTPEQLETKIEALKAQVSQTQAFFDMFGMEMIRATHVEENFSVGAVQD
jgi:LmbE family N-acetylglucosaminyl deacetylase